MPKYQVSVTIKAILVFEVEAKNKTWARREIIKHQNGTSCMPLKIKQINISKVQTIKESDVEKIQYEEMPDDPNYQNEMPYLDEIDLALKNDDV